MVKARQKSQEDAELARHLPVVRRLARRWRFTGHYDDLVAVGLERIWGVLKADRELATPLLTQQALWAMQEHLRHVRPGKRRRSVPSVMSLDKLMLSTDDDGSGFQPAALEQSDDEQLSNLRLQAVEHMKRTLPERLAFIVDELLLGKTQADIALALGISPGRVSQLVKRAYKQLAARVRLVLG